MIVRVLAVFTLLVLALEHRHVMKHFDTDRHAWLGMVEEIERRRVGADACFHCHCHCFCDYAGGNPDDVNRPYAGPADCGDRDRYGCITDRLRAHLEAFESGTTMAEVERASPTGVAFVKPTRVRSASR